jgi:DNA-binding transcriptional regulator GbsR (MarR family)
MDALVNFLFAQNPAFVRGRSASRTATNSLGQHAEALTSRTRFGARTPVMEDDFYGRLASNCLEDGCSTQSVEYLVSALKGKKDATKEEKEMIKELEMLIGKPEDNKNALEKLVGQVASVFSAPSQMQSAQNCLDGGCSVETVEELLAVLKADEDPDEQVVKIIAQLEKLLETPEANKNDIEVLVKDVLRVFSTLPDPAKDPALGYTGGKATP